MPTASAVAAAAATAKIQALDAVAENLGVDSTDLKNKLALERNTSSNSKPPPLTSSFVRSGSSSVRESPVNGENSSGPSSRGSSQPREAPLPPPPFVPPPPCAPPPQHSPPLDSTGGNTYNTGGNTHNTGGNTQHGTGGHGGKTCGNSGSTTGTTEETAGGERGGDPVPAGGYADQGTVGQAPCHAETDGSSRQSDRQQGRLPKKHGRGGGGGRAAAGGDRGGVLQVWRS